MEFDRIDGRVKITVRHRRPRRWVVTVDEGGLKWRYEFRRATEVDRFIKSTMVNMWSQQYDLVSV